jgi:aminopeptidase N
MQRLLGMLLALMTTGVSMAEAVPLEPGVSLALAQQRYASLSTLHYDLHLQIPVEQSQPKTGRLILNFEYLPTGKALPLDFRVSVIG